LRTACCSLPAPTCSTAITECRSACWVKPVVAPTRNTRPQTTATIVRLLSNVMGQRLGLEIWCSIENDDWVRPASLHQSTRCPCLMCAARDRRDHASNARRFLCQSGSSLASCRASSTMRGHAILHGRPRSRAGFRMSRRNSRWRAEGPTLAAAHGWQKAFVAIYVQGRRDAADRSLSSRLACRL
jgi:hypothetical protein